MIINDLYKKSHISYVVPSYNSALTLSEAIESIFNNNFTSGDEVIIVNDASTDETKNIVEYLATKYSPNIKIINNVTNKGCPASRNIGIKIAVNELIFNLDADNVLAPNSVNALKEFMFKTQSDIASFQEYHYFKTNTKKVTHKWVYTKQLVTLADFLSGIINPGPGGNFLYKKKVWQQIGGYDEYGKGLHEAWGFSLKLLRNNAKFGVVPNTLYFHRYSHPSLFTTETNRKNESIKVTNQFIKPVLPKLDQNSQDFIKNNPNWFESLPTHPLKLKDEPIGVNGKIVYTSLVKQTLKNILAIIKK